MTISPQPSTKPRSPPTPVLDHRRHREDTENSPGRLTTSRTASRGRDELGRFRRRTGFPEQFALSAPHRGFSPRPPAYAARHANILVTGPAEASASMRCAGRAQGRRPFSQGGTPRRSRSRRAGDRRTVERGLDRLGGRIDVLTTMPASSRRAGRRDHAQWVGFGADPAVNRSLRRVIRLALLHSERGRRADRQHRSRAAYRGDSPDHWHYAASKAEWWR